MRPIVALLLGTTLITPTLITPAMADTRLQAVTLSTAGVAVLDVEGQMSPDGLRLTLRRTDMNDFLKSLRLDDPAGWRMPSPSCPFRQRRCRT